MLGARPRTLPAAIVPVALGAGAAAGDGGAVWWRLPLALVVSLALQVGVNYANDYSDGVRGTDDARVGPLRLVASGLVAPGAVKRAAFIAFGIAAVAGLILAAATTWWLLAVGAASILAAWFYTGGPRPYGYAGLGELFVFVFFGLVATVGTTYVVDRASDVAQHGDGRRRWMPGLRPAGDQQPARPTVGRGRRQADAGGAHRRRVDPGALRRVARRGIRLRCDRRSLAPVGAPGVRSGAAGGSRGPPRTRGAAGRELIAVLGATGRVQLTYGAFATLGLVLSR